MQGTVQKIMTLTDGSVRFFVDVPMELSPPDAMAMLYQNVTLLTEKEIKEHGEKKRAGRTGEKAKKRRR